MYVCICSNVTEQQIIDSVQLNGCNTVDKVCDELDCTNYCGRCTLEVEELVTELVADLV